MEKSPRFKVVLSKQVKKKLSKVSKKDRKMLEGVFRKLSENPFLGEPVDYEPMKPMPWETCKCGKPLIMLWDRNSDEVDISCADGKCDGFWTTKKEIDAGRTKRLKRELHANKKECKRHYWVKCPDEKCSFAFCKCCQAARACNCKHCRGKSLKQSLEDLMAIRKMMAMEKEMKRKGIKYLSESQALASYRNILRKK